MLVDTIVIVVSLFLLLKQTMKSEWVSVFVFVGLMMLLYVLQQPNYVCVGVPAIVVCVMALTNIESFENNKKEKKEEKEEEKEEEKDEDDDEEEPEINIDIGKTFRDAYANLNPEQIEHMTKDTQDLVKTQTNLIKTLQNLEPVVKQGISLLDKFQGEGSTSKMFKELAQKADISKMLNSDKKA